MANPWEQDWSGQSSVEGNPWDKDWSSSEEAPKGTSWTGRVGGEIAAVTNLVFNIPSFAANALGTATAAPVEMVRGSMGKLQEGESPYAWERASSKMQNLTAPITDNISRVYQGLVGQEGAAGMEESTTNKFMHKISQGVEALAQKGQEGIGLDPGATRWMADAAMMLFGDMAVKGLNKGGKKLAEAQAKGPAEVQAEKARRENLGYDDPAVAEMMEAARKEESSQPLKYDRPDSFSKEGDKFVAEPTVEGGRIPEEGLDYSDFAGEYRSRALEQGLVEKAEQVKKSEIDQAWEQYREAPSGLSKTDETDLAYEQRLDTDPELEPSQGTRQVQKMLPPIKQRGSVNPEVFMEGFKKLKEIPGKAYDLVASFNKDKGSLVINAVKDGKNLGGITVGRTPDGNAAVKGAMVDPSFQRQGIATEAYKYAQELGLDVQRSMDQTPAGKALWESFERKGMTQEGRLPGQTAFGKSQRGSVMNPVEAAAELIKSGGNMLAKAQEIYNKYGAEQAKQFIIAYNEQRSQQQLQNTPKDVVAAVEDLVATNLNAKTANNRIVHNNARKLAEMAPEDVRVKAASAIEQGTIDSLPPEGQALAKKYQALVKDIGERAVEKGVLDGLLENYVTHAIDWKKSGKSPTGELLDYLVGTGYRVGGGMSPRSKFGKERKHRTFEDLQQAIKESDLELVTQDVAELYKIYANSMERAIENRKLVDNLKEVKNEFGDNVLQKVTEDTPPPRGWDMLDSPQFRGYAVHPELMPALKFALEQTDPNMFFQAVHNISQLTKRLNVVGSFFHAKSLLEAFWSSTNPAHLVKEMSLGAWDKAMGTQHAGITRALDQFKNGGLGDKLDQFIRDGGLELAVPEDVVQGLLARTGAAADSMISKYAPTNRILERSLNKAERFSLGLTDKLTWDYLHTGLKASVALKYLEEARQRAIQNGEVFNEKQAMQEISSNLNNTFGGLNWFEVARRSNTEMGKKMAMAAMNPAARKALQVLLFAPDWTISTLRAFTTALPKSLNPAKWHPIEGIKGMRNPKTETDYARLYQMKTALTYLTILNGINILTSGRNIWENKDPSRIEFRDGTSMQAAKHAMEPYHWIADPDKTLSNKLGFVPRSAIIGFGGVEYSSPTAPKMVDPSGLNRAKAVASGALPFQVTAAAQAPEGEGLQRALYGTLGVPVYGSTKEQRRKRNQERRKEEIRLRREWKKKARERGWE